MGYFNFFFEITYWKPEMSWRTLPRVVKELRVVFCPFSSDSAGMRSFITGQYKSLKGANPRLPILIRECPDNQPKLTCRFDFGVEESFEVPGYSDAQIASTLNNIIDNQRLMQKRSEDMIDSKILDM